MQQKWLSPREFAHAIGVSESSIKRWTDGGRIDAHRTEGGHRRIPLSSAIRFVRDNGITPVRPEILELGELPDIEATDAEQAAHLLSLLEEGRSLEARSFVIGLYASGESLARIIDGPLRRSLRTLGERWTHDEDGIFVEHRATDICIQGVNELRSIMPDPGADAPVAVGGAVPGDPSLLPSMCAALVLQSIGFETVNVGADTPLSALEIAVEEHRPLLLWLSLSHVASPESLRSDIERFVDRMTQNEVNVAIGGRELDALALRDVRGAFVGRNMAELTAYAKGLATNHRTR